MRCLYLCGAWGGCVSLQESDAHSVGFYLGHVCTGLPSFSIMHHIVVCRHSRKKSSVKLPGCFVFFPPFFTASIFIPITFQCWWDTRPTSGAHSGVRSNNRKNIHVTWLLLTQSFFVQPSLEHNSIWKQIQTDPIIVWILLHVKQTAVNIWWNAKIRERAPGGYPLYCSPPLYISWRGCRCSCNIWVVPIISAHWQ